MIQNGDLVRIKTSFSRKHIGKLAIITHRDSWNANILIIDTGEQDCYAISKLGAL